MRPLCRMCCAPTPPPSPLSVSKYAAFRDLRRANRRKYKDSGVLSADLREQRSYRFQFRHLAGFCRFSSVAIFDGSPLIFYGMPLILILRRFSNSREVLRGVPGGVFLGKTPLNVRGSALHQLENRYRGHVAAVRDHGTTPDFRSISALFWVDASIITKGAK